LYTKIIGILEIQIFDFKELKYKQRYASEIFEILKICIFFKITKLEAEKKSHNLKYKNFIT